MLRSLLFLFVALCGSSSLAVVENIPLEVFAKNNLYDDAKISPDGSLLAVTVPKDDGKVLLMLRLEKETKAGKVNLKPLHYIKPRKDSSRISNFYWASDRRILYSVSHTSSESERYGTYGEIFAMDFDGKKRKHVFGGLKNRAWGAVSDLLPNDPKHILVAARQWGSKTLGTMGFKVNIYTGKSKKIAVVPVRMGGFIPDIKGDIRVSYGVTNELVSKLFLKGENFFDWKQIDENLIYPVGFTRNNRYLLVFDGKDNGIDQLYKMDINTRKKTLIFKHDVVDIDRAIRYPDGKGIMAVEYEPDFPKLHFLDPENKIAAAFKRLVDSFPYSRVRFTSFTKKGDKAIVRISADKSPGTFYMYDISQGKLMLLFKRNNEIDPKKMVEMAPIKLKVRDKQTIYGYLTTPLGKENAKGLPMVVIPHGGPRARDHWGFDTYAQLLANRGYAVLQINFRGSSGYGQQYMHAGDRQWGGLTQNDIIDATRWAIKDGVADKDRICIYGGSFGGYSALMNVVLEPDLYQCAVGYIGVYDLELMYEEGDVQRRKSGINSLKEMLGEDEAELRRYSPVHHADKIKVPVLLVHGEDDERAPFEHAKRMQAALEKHHVSVETLYKDKEEHGFYNEENREEFFNKLILFLNKHTAPKKH